MKFFAARCWLLAAFAEGAESGARCPNIQDIAADLTIPEVAQGDPAAGKRVTDVTAGWQRSEIRHILYLPQDWQPQKVYPILVEYPGNGGYRNDLGDVSDGTPDSCMLGYGLSGGNGFIWVSLPFIEVTADGSMRNCPQWWGDVEETKRYCVATVRDICERYGGDKSRVVLCGFSRGAIACNYIGLNDDAIAALWCGFFCHSHYDGVRTWPYPDSDPSAAVRRLGRLNNRPQWISHEMDISQVKTFLNQSGVSGPFTLMSIPYPNHSAAWVLREIPQRTKAREWLHRIISHKSDRHPQDDVSPCVANNAMRRARDKIRRDESSNVASR